MTIIIKMTICKTLRHCGLKSCSAYKVPQLNVQARLKFVNNHLDDIFYQVSTLSLTLFYDNYKSY